MSEDDKSNHTASEIDISEQKNVDRIREILFGGQMRNYEHRFIRLEERITQENSRLVEDFDNRFSKFEQFVRGELEQLLEKLRQERGERAAVLKNIEKQLFELEQNINERLEQADGRSAKELMEVRQQLHDQSTQMQTRLRQQHDELVHQLQQETLRLQEEKTGHTDLAELFSEISIRLAGEFKLPDAE